MVVQYFQFLPVFKNHILLYKVFIIFVIILIYSTALLLGTLAFAIKYRERPSMWLINILKITIPFISYFFFGQILIVLTSVFYCRKEESYESPYLHCLGGFWIYSMVPAAIIGIILQIIIGFITNTLYFTQYFEKGRSDILKRIDTFPDVVFMLTKISVIFLFISDKGYESEHWAMLLFLIFMTGLNTYSNFFFRYRKNKILLELSKSFSLITFLVYLNILIGKIFLFFNFNGLFYLLVCDIILFVLYIQLYKIDDFNTINENFQILNNANHILNYIFSYYSIITNFNNKRDSFFKFHSLVTKIEEKCYNIECPLKKYLINISNGIEYKYLLLEYCDKLYQQGLSKFQDDINIKYHYTIFLIMQMNNKKKASILLNSLKYKLISFKANYDFYRCQYLLDNYNFQVQKKNSIIFKYRSNVINLKNLISKVTLFQYEFLTFIYGSQSKRDDNFKKIYELGSKILKHNKEIEKLFNELIIEKTNNIEIINLYSDFVEKILEDEEKLKKCQEMRKIIFNSNFHFYEKDFSNFDMRFLKDKDNYSYMIVSANHKTLGMIKDCSKNLVNIFGYEKKQLVGQHINILIPEIMHNKHDLILRRTSENHKLNFFENSYKRKVYNPDFTEKSVYGLSRAKFLIPIKLFIYLINTEENELVYVVEIHRKIPLMNEIIANKLPCCVLTNENFIIQSFTSNSMGYLNLKDNHISNYDIVNNIKEFQDDFVINTTHLSKGCTIKESSILNHKKLRNNLNVTNLKNSIKTDILNRYYYRRCRITWLINKKKKSKLRSNNKRRSSSFNISFKKGNSIIKEDDNIEIEIELDMEIKKIILDKILIGYYFFFTRVKPENKIENNKIKFKENEDVDNMKLTNYMDKNYYSSEKLNQTVILSDPSFILKEKNNNIFRRRSCFDFNGDNSLIGPDYICKSPCNFIFDVNSLTYIYSTEKDNNKQLNAFLKKDVSTKIKMNQFQYNSIKNRAKIFSLSQIRQYESTEIIEKNNSRSHNTSSIISSSYSNSGSGSGEYTEESSSSYILNKNNKNNFKLGYVKRGSKNLMTEIKKNEIQDRINHNKNDSGRLMNRNINNIKENINKLDNSSIEQDIRNNYYTVNMKHIHFLVFDFYREIFVEKKDIEKAPKIEIILRNLKKDYLSQFCDDDKYPFIVVKNENKKRDGINDNKQNGEKAKEENKKKLINEEKILEKKIKYSINNEKDELPIIKLKFYSIIYLIILMILLTICYIYFDNNYYKIKNVLTLIKDIVKIKFCNRMSVFFVGESTLVNFNASKIVGGLFTNFPGNKNNKKAYIQLLREKIKETFLESELCFEEILSTKISFSKNTTNFLNNILLDTHYIYNDGRIESIISDIFTTLMHYNGAFYNLAFSPLALEQNHTDILNFLHNSFNDYFKGMNLLISIYCNEMNVISRSIFYYWIISLIIFFVIYVVNYIVIIHYYIIGNIKRTSFLEVFFELNEKVLRILISNCENLLKKLKESELKEDDDENFDDNLDKKVYFLFKEKQTKRNSLIFQRNSEVINNKNLKIRKKLSKPIRRFMNFFGFCLLITFVYFIYNAISCINLANDAKHISEYLDKSQNFQTVMVDLFVAYRQYIFDDSILIYNMLPFDYLSITYNNSYITISNDITFIRNFNKKYLSNGEINNLLTKNFCSYNYTDRYSTYDECSKELYFLLNYNFSIIAMNFLEGLRKDKYVLRYLLSTGKIIGGLNDYNQDLWLKDERMPVIGKNNTGGYIFRLDLYNDDTVHGYLDLIFVNIILPYMDINRKYVIPFLSVDGRNYFLKLTSAFYVLVVVLIFLIYVLLKIKFLNKHIYRTKNLLRLIPLNILMSLNNIKSLLDLN